MAFLEIRDLSSGYGELQILWGVSIELEAGKLTALVGSNGVGKTTLLRSVVGLVKPWEGSVTFGGRDLTRVSPHAKAAQGLVLVPEAQRNVSSCRSGHWIWKAILSNRFLNITLTTSGRRNTPALPSSIISRSMKSCQQ